MNNERYKSETYEAYQPSPYAVVQDIFEEVVQMTDIEYDQLLPNYDEFILPPALVANDAIVKMMK